MNILGIIKTIGAWGCLLAAAVLLIMHVATDLVMPLSVISIAFSQAPNG